MQRLENYIKTLVNADESEWLHFKSFVTTKSLKAGDFFFKQGESANVLAFVDKGLVFSYFIDPDGAQRIKKFSWEGFITGPYSSLISGHTTCDFSAEALENSDLFCIEYSDLLKLYESSATWQKFGRLIAEQTLIEKEIREYEILCLGLADRYRQFLKTHEYILNRIPQYLVASYLGVNATSLSRLRGKKASTLA